MSYAPRHLEVLDKSGTIDGWPKIVTEPAKEFAVLMLKRGFAKFGQMDIELARRCIFDDYVRQKGELLPECFNGLCTYDLLYAITHRALLGADAEQVWKPKS